MRKKERTVNKLRNEKGEITTENSGIQGSKRDYCEQLYGNKINLGEMDRFLETLSLTRLNQVLCILRKPNQKKAKTKNKKQKTKQTNAIILQCEN